MELTAPYVARDNPDVVELQGNRTSGYRGALRLPLRCEIVQPEQPFLVWPEQPAAQEMLLGLQYLYRSSSAAGEEEASAKTKWPCNLKNPPMPKLWHLKAKFIIKAVTE